MLKIFANKGDAEAIPINAENLNYNFNEVLNLVYPIGTIIVKDSDTDYSNYLGFSWQKVFAGKTLVGLDSSDADFNEVGKTGGEKTHTLTQSEMPKHYHSSYIKDFLGGTSGATTPSYFGALLNSSVSYNYATGVTNATKTSTSEVLGNSQSHNNLQPYEVVVFWKRVE